MHAVFGWGLSEADKPARKTTVLHLLNSGAVPPPQIYVFGGPTTKKNIKKKI
jgi:hypothetical protein